MPFHVVGEAPMTESIELRMKPREKQRLRDDAELAGTTISEFVRRRALAKRVLAATDLATVRHLRRLGAELKAAHSAADPIPSQRMLAALESIRHFVDGIAPSGGHTPGRGPER